MKTGRKNNLPLDLPLSVRPNKSETNGRCLSLVPRRYSDSSTTFRVGADWYAVNQADRALKHNAD
jgi:hypothetical protein